MIYHLSDETLFKQACLVGDKWTTADTGETLDVTTPVDGSALGVVPKLSASEVRRAIDVAHASFQSWRKTDAKSRSKLLRKWFGLIEEAAEDLGRILSAEQGKPLAESIGEVHYAASFLDWFSEEAKRYYGEIIPATAPNRRFMVLKEPVGVAALITPWNFPAAMITRKAGAALAAGCTVVIKPASATPFTALALAELALRAGIPAGVVNVVTGSAGVIGSEMTSHPDVRKLSFTGSTEIGRTLLEQCAGTIKNVSMELGGNAPVIVFDDADLDAAVAGTMASKFRNAGQTCVCANRIYVQNGIYDRFLEKLKSAVEGLKVGLTFEAGVEIGPLIDAAAVRKVQEHIDDAVAKGGRLITGGALHDRGGTLFLPTIVSDTPADAKVITEETFGPLAAIVRFETEDEALRMANETEYGLASYVFTNDLNRSWRVIEALEYGIVGLNEGATSTEVAPFGGVKQSGIGREGSRYGIEDYLEEKFVSLGNVG